MNNFVSLTVLIGRIDSEGAVMMLGTGFVVSNDGKIATSRHVVADNDENLVVLPPHIKNLNEYQDTSNNKCFLVKAFIVDSDPFRDISIIKMENPSFYGEIPELGSFNDVTIGEKISILGYPHCVEGRRVLTFQEAVVGAKVLLDSQGIKSRHAVINIQTRPGQSGSIIYSTDKKKILGMLVGTFAPSSGVMIAGINPRELNQTTHCISAEYIYKMI